MRECTFDENRCCVSMGALPRNPATLTNAATALIRCQGQFRYVTQANRRFEARPQEALNLLLSPASR